GFCFRPKICTNCPETVASGNAGAEAIGSSRLANTALRTLVVPELKLFRPHRAPKITQLSCRRRCDRRIAFWRRARRSPSALANPAPPPRGSSRPGLDHDGQRIPSKYDAYLGTELIVRASATPLLAAARALVALTV